MGVDRLLALVVARCTCHARQANASRCRHTTHLASSISQEVVDEGSEGEVGDDGRALLL